MKCVGSVHASCIWRWRERAWVHSCDVMQRSRADVHARSFGRRDVSTMYDEEAIHARLCVDVQTQTQS